MNEHIFKLMLNIYPLVLFYSLTRISKYQFNQFKFRLHNSTLGNLQLLFYWVLQIAHIYLNIQNIELKDDIH